jgi:acyl carrier protein
MSEQSVRAAIIDALGRVVPLRAEWTVRLQDSSFDLPIADLAIDSLDTLELCMEIEASTGVELEPAELVTVATIDELIGLVASKDRRAPASLIQAPRDQPLPLSLAQESIWNYCQALENPAAYVLGRIDKIEGPLDIAKLGECLSAIVSRHEILRTTFPVVDGRPIQRVHPAETVAPPIFDVGSDENPEQAAERIIEAARSSISNLADGPLCRFVLIRMGEQEHLLVRLLHHMLWDGWSGKLFLDELSSLYQAIYTGKSAVLPEMSLQYGDYAAWQRTVLDPAGRAYHELLAWWAKYFQDVPPLPELPFRRPEMLVGVDPSAGYLTRSIEPQLMERLSRLQREAGASLYKIWLAGFVAVLWLETDCSDIVVGSYVTNRRHRQTRNMIGDFSNTIALRFKFDADISFRELISRVGDTVVAAESHGEIPYEKLSKELQKLNIATPQIRAILTAPLDNHMEELSFAGLKVNRYTPQKRSTMRWGCTVELRERDEDYRCVIDFDAGIYDPSLVQIFMDRLYELLNSVSHQPGLTIRELR